MTRQRVATMEQRGGIGPAILAGLVLFVITRQRGAAAPAPEPVTGGVNAVGEVRNLAIAVSNPLDKSPGSIVGISSVAFDYRGPAQQVFVAWGIKPEGRLFGINFDNGAHLIERPVRAWSQLGISVPASGDFMRVAPGFTGTRANIAIPDPGVPQFGRDGGSVGLNFGTADVWIWIVSGAAVAGAVTGQEFRTKLTAETNILVLSTDADVFRILEPTASASALSVTFL